MRGCNLRVPGHELLHLRPSANAVRSRISRRCALQLGDDPTKEDVKTFTEKTLSSGKVRTHAAAPDHPVSRRVVPGDWQCLLWPRCCPLGLGHINHHVHSRHDAYS